LSALRIGTRGSALALAQATPVAEALGGELVVVRTAGDTEVAEPAHPPGDKTRWTGELERALLAGEIDLAVHSAKDVPGELAPGLALLAAGRRADPRDALCGATSLDALPPGARVGTSSLRRAAQLRAAREDLDVQPLRGNVDSRLRRLAEGDWDAIVLAAAGLARLGREGDGFLDAVPAPGQGIVVVEGRAGDARARAVADPDAEWALAAERAVAAALGATCDSALAAHAVDGRLRTWIGAADGSEWIADEVAGRDPEALGREAAKRLLAAGARVLLDAEAAAA
jgi:hydroxymethylbilane synthase